MRYVCLAALALACLAGCNHGNPPLALQPALGVDHNRPEALVSSMQAAMAGGDYAALTQCMDPDARDQFQEVLDKSKAYTTRVAQTVALIREKIGDRQADTFRDQAFMGMLTSPLGDAAKGTKINWGKVKIHQDKDIATVTSDSDFAKSFSLIEKDGKWYLDRSFYAGGLPSEGLAWYDKAFAKFTADMDTLEGHIRDGQINKKNFDRAVLGEGRKHKAKN
jgi:hypothetical protein